MLRDEDLRADRSTLNLLNIEILNTTPSLDADGVYVYHRKHDPRFVSKNV